MKLIFAGTPEFAAVILRGLFDSAHHVEAVYTQPDRAAGRGRKLRASAVKQIAVEHGTPVMQPPSLRDADEQHTLAQWRADALIVAAYGLILPPAVLAIPPLGCINVHASLLPRWRGAAPIQRAIEAGDTETGVCIMRMDKGLDTGAVFAERRLVIGGRDNAGQVHDALAELGRDLLLETLEALQAGQARETPQDDRFATYAHRFGKDDARIDWTRDAHAIDRQIRAFNPAPGAWTEIVTSSHPDPLRLRILGAHPVTGGDAQGTAGEVLSTAHDTLLIACGQDAIAAEHVQLAGKRAVSAAQFINARTLSRGDRLQ